MFVRGFPNGDGPYLQARASACVLVWWDVHRWRHRNAKETRCCWGRKPDVGGVFLLPVALRTQSRLMCDIAAVMHTGKKFPPLDPSPALQSSPF